MKQIFIALALVMMIPFQAKAAGDLWCRGNLSQVYVDRDGNVIVYATFRSDYVMLCNVNSTWKGISTSACAAMFTTALAVHKTNSIAQIFYLAPTVIGKTCATIPTYNSAPSPLYVMISK